MNPYANMILPGDVGQQVRQGWDRGRQMRQERDTKNALMQYYGAQMGDDPAAKSLMPVLQANPELGGRLLSQHQEQRSKTQQQQIEMVGRAAAMADTPEKWDQIIDQLAMEGIPGVEKYKGKFSPGLRAAIMAKAGVDPEKPVQAPSAVREWAHYQSLPPEQRPQFDKFRQSIPPQIFGSAESGYQVYDPNGGGQGGPARVQDKAQYDALPPGTQYIAPDGSVRVKGGQTGSAPSGGFPGN